MEVSVLSELPFFHLDTAELCRDINDRYDSIFSHSELRDFINDIDVVHDINQLNFDYVTESEFNSKFASLADRNLISFSVFHVNIRSLNSNHRKLCQFLQLLSVSFDIIVLTEIWSSNIDCYTNIIPGYNFYYSLPLKGTVGGVGIFVADTLYCSENFEYTLESTDSLRVENIWLTIGKNNQRFILGGIYRHPGSGIDEFSNKLDLSLSKISSQSCPCIIAGDINIDLTKTSVNSKTAEYVSNLLSNNFLPTIVMPTRITPRSSTLIDHLYYYEGKKKNCEDFDLYSGNFIHDLTDHLPNYLLLVNKKPPPGNVLRPFVRIYSKKNTEVFLEEIENSNWDVIYNENDANAAYENFIGIIKNSFEKCFPLRRLSRKRMKDKPWITSALKKSSIIKNKLYRKWILTRSPEDEERYKNYKKIFKKTLIRC